MYESLEDAPLSQAQFLLRLGFHFFLSTLVVFASLLLGMAGYQYYEHLDWRDAFLNAAMLLGGMGPVETPQTPGGKLFAGFYALYAGLVFIVAIGILLAPAVHRLMHRFHWDEDSPRWDPAPFRRR